MQAPAPRAVDYEAITRIQDRAIGETASAIRPGGAVVVQAPTGAGKTRINSRNVADFRARFLAEHGREPVVLAAQHRENLLTQNRDAFRKWAPEVAVPLGISTEGAFDRDATINFATVQTAADAALPKIDLLTIDEGHHASDAEGADYTKLINRAFDMNPDMVLLANTATPHRPDKRGLHPRLAKADNVVIGYKEIEAAGQIILPRTKTVDIRTDDGSSLTHVMRQKYRPDKDADAAGLNKALKAAKPLDYNDQMLSAWERHFSDRIAEQEVHAGTLVFESTIASARKFADDARERGHSVAVMDSKQDKADNDRALADYAAGKVDMIVSVKMIDEGIDVPHTRAIIINRETTSETEYHQMVGRAMRTGEDPALQGMTPMVFDGGASTMIHGAVERRAAVIDYLQKLGRGELGAEKVRDEATMPSAGDGYSPWHLHKEPPPVMAMTDGEANIYAVVTKSPDGERRFTLAEARDVKGRSQVTIMKGVDGRPMTDIDSAKLVEMMQARIMAKREDVLRLEVSESLVSPGKSLAEDRFSDAQASSAVLFAASMRQTGASR